MTRNINIIKKDVTNIVGTVKENMTKAETQLDATAR